MSEKPRIRVKASSVPRPPLITMGHNGGPRLNVRNDFDGGRQRRRLAAWQPTQATVNGILAAQGALLRARCRDILRNNPHANAGSDSFTGNMVGAGIKPSSLLKGNAALRAKVMELWRDWTDEADADGITDFYGLQTLAARALFEAGEVFIRFRPRLLSDGLSVPLQVQLYESEMCPYWKNETATNGNEIMNGIELDFRGQRVAYHFYRSHPGDASLEGNTSSETVRVPASEIKHVFICKRPGQMRGVPLVTPALVKLFMLDQYDDAELERKKVAAMFAGFVTSPAPEDVLPIEGEDTSATTDNIGLASLEPGTMQSLLPGEEVAFSTPADVGGSYELFQYRQLLAIFAAMGVPYTLGTGDLKRANYSSLRGAVVEFRTKLEQFQHNVIIPMMCRPIWLRWMNDAVLSGALKMPGYVDNWRNYSRCKWIPPRYDWVDPLKDIQAEKLAVDAGFKSRSDVVEAGGIDPEENDARIAEDRAREKQLELNFAPAQGQAPAQDNQDAADQAAQDAADDAASDKAA